MTFPTMPDRTTDYRIKIGQRFNRVGYTAVIYRSAQVLVKQHGPDAPRCRRETPA